MLINFVMKNYRSFYEKTCFSMFADTQKREFKDSLISVKNLKRGGPKVVPSMVIYGSNASGKTSLISGINVLKQIVINGTIKRQVEDKYIRELDVDTFLHEMEKYKEPMHLEITFKASYNIYNYSLEFLPNMFNANKRVILNEDLSLINYKNIGTSISEIKTTIFSRTDTNITINTDPIILALIDKPLSFSDELLNLQKMFSENIDSEDLFLTTGFKSMISLKIESEIIDWFQSKLLTIINFNNKELKINFSSNNDEDSYIYKNKSLDRLIKLADFGPQEIGFKKDESTGKYNLNSVYELKENILNDKCKVSRNIVLNSNITESKGTIKLVDFWIPFMEYFKRGGVFIIDELDASIHPELILGIISLFNNPEINIGHAQLIFNTHNPVYLNKSFFRRDQFMFVEKDKDTYMSKIYKLSDFNVRADLDYMKNYFEGKFGALPFIDFESALPDDEEV